MTLQMTTGRHQRTARTLSACLCAMSLWGMFGTASDALSSDWDRFRGPNGTGISPDPDPLPTTFSETENLQWKVALPGAGVSCPIVVGDKVFVTCYSGYGLDRRDPGKIEDLKRHVVCLDRATGKTIWEKVVAAVLPEDTYSGMGVPEHGYASHTPTSDGKNIYVFFGKSGVFAYDLDGNQLWQTSVGTDSDDRTWGSSSSPILTGDVVVVVAGPESRAIVGLDKATGKELWRADGDALGNVWGTPALVKIDETRTDVVIGAPNEIWGLNPATGKLKWYCAAMATDQFNSSVVVADHKIYAVEGRGGGSIAIRTGGKGDITKTDVVWSGRDSNRFSTPLLYEGRMYLISGSQARCVNAENDEEIFKGRLQGSGAVPANEAPADSPRRRPGAGPGQDNEGQPGSQPPRERGGRGGFGGGGFGGGGGSDYSSPVLGDSKIYYVTRDGDIHVIRSTDRFEQLATNRVTAESEDFSATPAISAGQIFFRSNKYLYCVSLQK